MKRNEMRSLMVLAAVAMTGNLHAAEASLLGPGLTPLGGEAAANKDGSIPAWASEQVLADGWSYGKPRGDFFKFKDEKPKFTIDASNADTYADRLTPGQRALFKQKPDYKMEVYPTHRYCSAPDFVLENTKQNVTEGKIAADGWSLGDAIVPGIPFPQPKSGLEVLWNSKMRYLGVGIVFPSLWTMLSPRKGADDWIEAESTQTIYYPSGEKGSRRFSELQPIEFYTYFAYLSPTALAGQALSIITYSNKGNDTFYYFPGQRRVRRMPSYAYDAPQIGFENQYTLDEPRMFNGTPDRFDWTLKGKKEIYVPYSSFGMYDSSVERHQVMTPNGPVSAARRYELHRVWEVEATVKPGVRHVAPKRTYYFDEDSWVIVAAEDYDAQGNLWKVRESYTIPVAETGSCDGSAFVQYDLASGRVVYDQGSLGAKPMKWAVESGDNPKLSADFYTPDNLRAVSAR
ncbi:DUF1329 domain-containing protein [Nitrogeniibacter aestuarii]|uniref:DUF1329 domain-containing protein n=1 Tax=Nitrogeniibacter aestuarii TaxID=2815343 RepID=UPI001D11483B|nr:DUF1329 domain-containing protein [Nitrogeniibacter aestuarii]